MISKGPLLYFFSSHSSLYVWLFGRFAINAQRKGAATPSEITKTITVLNILLAMFSFTNGTRKFMETSMMESRMIPLVRAI
jgi:hypothetical protein